MFFKKLFPPKPDVGVVMPVYIQEPRYLRLALQTILKQSYSNYELVVVVDGAPEMLPIIHEETAGDSRVHLIVKERNEGVSKALNTGFEYLMNKDSVKYFTWVSSDNVYYPNFLEELRDVLEQGPPELGLVYSSFRHVDEEGCHKHNEQMLVNFRKYMERPKEALLDFCFVGVSFMYKKEFAAKIDGYHFEPVEDYEYWLRLTEHCDIKYLPKELMDYRENSPHSISLRIHSTKEQHRLWRKAYNEAKQQAKDRRGVSYETTIILPVRDSSEATLEKLDEVLEQFYHNYKLWVVDITQDSSALAGLRQIEDPRMSRMALPGDEVHALRFMLQRIGTPFAMLYVPSAESPPGDAIFNVVSLYHMLEAKGQPVVCTYYNKEGTVTYRTTPHAEWGARYELYKTSTLKKQYNIEQ